MAAMTGIDPKRSANMARIGPRDTAPELAALTVLVAPAAEDVAVPC